MEQKTRRAIVREIKFRGKRKDNGEWVYGWLVNNRWGDYAIELKLSHNLFIVHEDTIGQYTGLKDKNGREIYEGDILRKELKDEVVHYLVDFGNWQYPSSFILVYKHPYQVFLLKHTDDLEVIGNIHDNPELLEAKK